MPATGKVSLSKQTIYTLIPFLGFYAAYRIKKLRWIVTLVLVLAIPVGVASIMVDSTYDFAKYNPVEKIWELTQEGKMFVIVILIKISFGYGIAVYLIRRWSKKWNLQFGKSE